MLVKDDYVNKKDVVYVKEDDSIEHVLEVLEKSGYRCIPVLDETATTYAGNIYKVDLLEYEIDHSLKGPLSRLIRDKDGYVKEEEAFFKVFSMIKRLPYLAVVNEEKEFLGILTNGNVLQVLEGAWGVNEGSYALTIGTIEYAGALTKMLRVINKYCTVQSVISLKNNLKFVRRVLIVLPKEVDESIVKEIADDLEHHNFTITDIEKMN